MRLFPQRIVWACIATLAFAMPITADQHENAEADAVVEAEADPEAKADDAEVEPQAEADAEAEAEAEPEAEDAPEAEAEDEAEAEAEDEAEAEAEDEAEAEAEAEAKPAQVGDYEETGLYVIGTALFAVPLEKGDLEDANNANLMATSTNVDDSWGFGTRIGYRAHKHLGIEAEFDMLNNIELDTQTLGVESKTEIRVFHVTGNAKGYLLTGRFQPFVMGGAGWGRSVVNPDGRTSKRDDGFVGRVGGGFDLYGSRDVAFTGDVSYLFAPGLEDLDHLAIKAGLLLRFFAE